MIVEGVQYEIPWSKFKKGSDLFFPCLDCKRVRREIRLHLASLRISTVQKVVIVDGIRGLRVWRV